MRCLLRRWVTSIVACALAFAALMLAQADEDLAYFGHLRWDGGHGGYYTLRVALIFAAYGAIWLIYEIGVHHGRIAERLEER